MHFIDLKLCFDHLTHDLNLKAFENFNANILNTTYSHLSVKFLSIQCISSTCILKWVAWRLEVNCLLLSLSAIDWLLTMYWVEVFYSCACTILYVFLVGVLMPVWNHKKATLIVFIFSNKLILCLKSSEDMKACFLIGWSGMNSLGTFCIEILLCTFAICCRHLYILKSPVVFLGHCGFAWCSLNMIRNSENK